ncbi:ead/Ea22-like family protein [Klebsiella michiganensis]|uniref:ead/Ea22-like family protein n=1 Tax=Klebsiella michiganensis TaxID=1134687 RepID=UPI0035D6A45C|nr:ead/Ea22-like family protein [Klebsiella oxytoca]
MTTDITALAQSLKAAAEKAIAEEGSTWWNEEQLASDYGLALHRTDAKFIALASHENVLALVEALEKAQAINAAAEKLVRCKGRYHSEQNYRALAALFGVTTPDLPPLEHENVHYADAAEMEIAALRQRIAELEEAEQKLCAANVTLDARAELAERQLAKLESRTVKLPAACADDEYFNDGVFQPMRYERDVERALRAAGIKVEAE